MHSASVYFKKLDREQVYLRARVYICVYIRGAAGSCICARNIGADIAQLGEKIERASMRSSTKLSLLAAHFALIDALSAD